MSIELPAIVSEYFSADKEKGADAVAACFAADGIVKDEGQTFTGREAIRQWKAHSGTKYTYTADPVSIAVEGDRTVVTSHVVGNFPGSPIDLRYFFTFAGDRIATLEITV